MSEKKITSMNKVVEVCKRRGIIFPTAEIYGGLSGFYDYGPVGNALRKKFENYWRDFFIRAEDNVVEMDSCTVLPEIVFIASGHAKGFTDPISQCKKCKAMHRADHLVEDATGKFVEGLGPDELTDIITKEKLTCPECKGSIEKTRVFNLMLSTEVSPTGGQKAYLRPETAQNIFIGFKRIFGAMRGKLPFGIAQIGHSFRNEISPRNFIVRIREFSQMEIEMFVDPDNIDDCPNYDDTKNIKIILHTRDTQKQGKPPVEITADAARKKGIVPGKYMAFYLAKQMVFYESLGIPRKHIRFRHMLPEETPHYSKGNFDLELEFDFGWKETVGNAFRGDYDLSNHIKYSKQDLTVDVDGRKVVANVVEPSFGVERTLNGILLHCFRDVGFDREWPWFAFPARLAPFTAGVFPLVSKDKLPEKAREVYNTLKERFDVFYDEGGSIGKRYARQDEVGTPFCVTIDYDSLKNKDCTIRDRDSMEQRRVKLAELPDILDKLVRGETKFSSVGTAIKK